MKSILKNTENKAPELMFLININQITPLSIYVHVLLPVIYADCGN